MAISLPSLTVSSASRPALGSPHDLSVILNIKWRRISSDKWRGSDATAEPQHRSWAFGAGFVVPAAAGCAV
jgi:hypothetical protein